MFVLGDTLYVRNEDNVSHQLGPLFIPPGTTASLTMDTLNDYSYSCSFKPTKVFGLDVREGTTLNVRLVALAFVSPATAVFFFLYSLVIYPINPKPRVEDITETE